MINNKHKMCIILVQLGTGDFPSISHLSTQFPRNPDGPLPFLSLRSPLPTLFQALFLLPCPGEHVPTVFSEHKKRTGTSCCGERGGVWGRLISHEVRTRGQEMQRFAGRGSSMNKAMEGRNCGMCDRRQLGIPGAWDWHRPKERTPH